MTKAVVIQIFAFALCIGAFLVSHLLYTAHRKANLPTWFRAGCGTDEAGSSANCDEVITSPYGYWPPKHADSPPDKKYTPVALMGMTYYGMLGMWILGVGRPDRSRRWLHAFPLGISVMGLAMSAWFMYLMFARLDYWCPWCTATHVMNLLIFVCLALMWPRAPRVAAATPAGGDAPAAPAAPPAVALPTMRQVAVTVAGMFVLWLGVSVFDFAYGLGERAGERDACMAILDGFKNDGRRLAQHYDTMPRKDITLRPDDPTRGGKAGEPGLPCVVFSDFECPACRNLATFLEERVAPLFDGNLKIVFKHFPLNTDCNSAVRGTLHKHACTAAALAEAARMQGGDDAFWRAHDYLFEHRATLSQITPEKLAEALGLDAERLRTDSAGDAVSQRMAEDVALAMKLQLRSTPTVYVGGKEVDMPGRGSMQFWDEIAGRYWQLRGVPRPEHTKVKKDAPATSEPPADHNHP
jgi:protein-disulfide isomerase/uncharacterized membrane protein